METTEGGRTYIVPSEDDPAFFNPAMELNRDITVAVLRAAPQRYLDRDDPTYLDAMAAAGIRGVRAGLEGYDVLCCDRSESALEFTRENLQRHDVDATVLHDDVRRVLIDSRFDVVDIDPFGSPIPYIDAAFFGTDGLLCVTATDTAPLCGAHHKAGIRRYGSVPANTVDHAEIGLRTLIGALVRRGASHDVAATPVLSHSSRHYHRTYLALNEGAKVADAALEKVGFIEHCQSCWWRETVSGLAPPLRVHCPVCDVGIRRIGPLYLGEYREVAFVEEVSAAIDETMGTETQAERLLARLADEAAIVGHLDHHALCDRLDIPAGPIDEVLRGLSERNYTATRTHFGGTTFKTDAPTDAVKDVIEATADSA